MTERILHQLALVDDCRLARATEEGLLQRVGLIKRFQQRRFERTYVDLLRSPRYQQAARFFLDELYGPGEFSQRDAQFARVVPKITRVMPSDVVVTVLDLASLHAITEALDNQMGRALDMQLPLREAYVRAWQGVGAAHQRQAQLRLVLELGTALDSYTRRAWLLGVLRMMRGPANAAGLGALQDFLEAGMSSFRSMGGAREFLEIIEHRESRLMDGLFNATWPLRECDSGPADPGTLADLPSDNA